MNINIEPLMLAHLTETLGRVDLLGESYDLTTVLDAVDPSRLRCILADEDDSLMVDPMEVEQALSINLADWDAFDGYGYNEPIPYSVYEGVADTVFYRGEFTTRIDVARSLGMTWWEFASWTGETNGRLDPDARIPLQLAAMYRDAYAASNED